jgi:hypothetical protein
MAVVAVLVQTAVADMAAVAVADWPMATISQ